MPASTPIARSKTAALCRVVDSIPKGYFRWTAGTVAPEKAERMVRKFHERHAIGATPAQRITRKSHGRANALLAVYWPEGAQVVHWLLLFTAGELDSPEALREVTDKRRLEWLGYELVRHPAARGRAAWTWRRPKQELAEHYALLAELLHKRHAGAVAELLQRLANQPGFHGVRAQSWELLQAARRGGYAGELPHLYFVQRVSHGDRMPL